MEKRESEYVEFKKSTSELKQAIISLTAMLNKNGHGLLYFGVLNNGDIFGVQIGKDTTRDISIEIRRNIKPFVVPTITVIKENGHDLIKVEINGFEKPYNAYGRYYIRSDDEDILMDNDVLKNIFINKNKDNNEWEKALSGHNLDCVDENLLIDYFNDANEIRRINDVYKDVDNSLNKLGLSYGTSLNNAGYYLFSNEKPLKLKLATFNSDDRISFSDIKLFEGNIFECIKEGIMYISEKMKWPAKIVGNKRIESPEIPLEAIREIVVNSFAHMKFNDPMFFNEIYLTPTKIVIRNPGSIHRQIKPELFADGKMGPILRNPLIAMTLYKNGTIDSFATGFQRTFELCKRNHICYEYINDEDSFTFIFLRNLEDSTKETINDSKQNNLKEVLDILKTNPYYTRYQISQKLQISEPTVSRACKALQEMHVIRRCGSNKTGYWEIINKLR